MRIGSVSYSRDGYSLEVTEIPLRVLVIRRLGGWALTATGHLFCCHLPEWTYRVGWGWDADYEILDHNLGSWLWNRMTKLECYGYRQEKQLAAVPITREVVLENFPEWRNSWPNDGEGDMTDEAAPALPDEPTHDAMTVKKKDYRDRDRLVL